jgi:hypothetical protein
MRFLGENWAEQATAGRVPEVEPAVIAQLLSRVIAKLD